MDVDEDRGIRPGYKLKLNSYDLGVDIELADALQRIRFEHPEVRSVIVTSAKRARVLLGRQHLHARHVVACVEGELLQVHERDAQRHRGLEPPFRAQVHRRVQRDDRRRRLRARARVRRDLPGRRPVRRREPARSAAARRAARHRRTDAPHRQAPRPARSRRHLLHAGRRRARAARAAMAAHRRPCEAAAIRANGEGARAGARRDERPAGGRDGHRARRRSRARSTTPATATSTSTCASTGARAAPRITVSAPKSLPAEGLGPIVAAGASWWPLAMARELDDAILLLRTNELDIGTWILKTAGDAVARARRRRDAAATPIALVRPRDDRHAAAHAGAARRHVAHALRADRAGIVLRRHAARARARRRSQLHARRCPTTRPRRRRSCCPRSTSARTRW